MTARSVRGIRTLDAADLFEGFMTTSLAEDELLSDFRLPLLPPDTRFGFFEFSRRAGDYVIAMSLVTFQLLDGVMADVRVGIGGAEGKPRRCALMLAVGVLEREPDIGDVSLMDLLASSLCRCMGYLNIAKAVRAAAAQMRSG